jgi:hypothetical protein
MIDDLRWLARKPHAVDRLTAFQLYTSPLAKDISSKQSSFRLATLFWLPRITRISLLVATCSFASTTHCRSLNPSNHHALVLLPEASPPGPRLDLLLAAFLRIFSYLQSIQMSATALMYGVPFAVWLSISLSSTSQSSHRKSLCWASMHSTGSLL